MDQSPPMSFGFESRGYVVQRTAMDTSDSIQEYSVESLGILLQRYGILAKVASFRNRAKPDILDLILPLRVITSTLA